MEKQMKRQKIDPKSPYLPQYYGSFEQKVAIGGKERRFLLYIPDGVRESCEGVLVLGENGKTADDLLRESGWCALTDAQPARQKFIVAFLEPQDGVWHTDEPYGKPEPDGDVAYVNAVWLAAGQRYLCCIHESKFYLAGCREGGTIAHMAAMANPAVYAGLATVGGSSVPPAYMTQAAQDFCTQMDGFIDESHRLNIRKGETPVPVWIVEDASIGDGMENGAAAYWRAACSTADTPKPIENGVEFVRENAPSYAENQDRAAFRVRVSRMDGASDDHANALIKQLCAFLFAQRRWMSGPVGDLRMTRDPVRDLGMEYHYEEIDGWMREWYVYVPETVKKHPEKRVPLVLAMHGYTCSGEIYAGNSEWHHIAKDNGFIVVYPTALYGTIEMENNVIDPNNTPLPAWNIFAEDDRPDELHFFATLLDQMTHNYPVDPQRVFATGHSWGSLMTQMLAIAMPERFAAVAPCSGVFFGGAEKQMLPLLLHSVPADLPVWMFCGEEESWLMPAQPTADNETGYTIALWLRRNGMEGQLPANWAACPPEQHGRWSDRVWQRNGMPLVRFTTVDYMPHATMPEMSRRIWDEFFSHFMREGERILRTETTTTHA